MHLKFPLPHPLSQSHTHTHTHTTQEHMAGPVKTKIFQRLGLKTISERARVRERDRERA